jgi:hypothetical protein
MKKAIGVLALVLILAAAMMAQEKRVDGTVPDGAIKVDGTAPGESGEAVKVAAVKPDPFRAAVEPVRPIRRSSEIPGETGGVGAKNGLLLAALWTATALDIHSASRTDKTRYHEANTLGGTGGQIATSAVATGAAFLIQRYGPRHMRWLSSALLAGGTAGHAFGAIHNYGLK